MSGDTRNRTPLSPKEARKLWAEKRKQGWQPTTAQWHPPSTSTGSTLRAAGETDQVIGSDVIRGATTNVQLHIVLVDR